MAYGVYAHPQQTRVRALKQASLCAGCPSRSKSVFASCTSSLCADVQPYQTSHLYPTGGCVYAQGELADGLYCIQSGILALRRVDEHGQYRILKLLYPGEVLGHQALLQNTLYTHSAVVLQKAQVCKISQEGMEKTMLSNVSFQKALLQHLASELIDAENARVRESSLPVKSRLAGFLKNLYQHLPQNHTVLHVPLQRQELAAFLGSRPETLARSIAELSRANIAHFIGREVQVLDKNALFACAG
jgi:CRP-like cAMP-binding protein